MGQLFSRAFKRITQCSQSRSQPIDQKPADERQDNSTRERESERPTSQIIPVGQSIDSAEYAALESENQRAQPNAGTVQQSGHVSDEKNNNKDVEEAAIKIQALVRGHLTRKALKDGQYQSNQSSPLALGQSQFDEDSLLRNPPSAVFAMANAPVLNGNGDFRQGSSSTNNGAGKSQLESIAELAETRQLDDSQVSARAEHEQREAAIRSQPLSSLADNNEQMPYKDGRTNSVPSKIRMPSEDSPPSTTSPSCETANASIDITWADTPASASIDILDHHLKPTDKMATVLHPKRNEVERPRGSSAVQESLPEDEETTKSPSGGRVPLIGTPDSLESEEAAAIRIQSAFRGYRTRKNSPYRTRSPPTSAHVPLMNGDITMEPVERLRSELEQQGATMLDEASGEQLELEAQARALMNSERRTSRPRTRRDSSPSGEKGIEPQEQTNTEEIQISGLSLSSLDGELATELATNLNDTAPMPSAALEVAESSASIYGQQQQRQQDQNADSRISFGAGSERTSITELDTDSSVLGAALSLNETEGNSLIGLLNKQSAPQTITAATTTTDELEFQARRLVEELNMATSPMSGSRTEDDADEEGEQDEEEKSQCAQLTEATRQLEEALEELPATDPIDEGPRSELVAASLSALDEAEQRAIELESDDIERRDPRGHASEERAKSPQIRSEPPEFHLDAQAQERNAENSHPDQSEESADQELADGRLTVDSLLEESNGTSGRSTPALNSSAAVSSSNDEADEDEVGANSGDAKQQASGGQQQRQTATVAGVGAKNKRKNRNKRKGKK